MSVVAAEFQKITSTVHWITPQRGLIRLVWAFLDRVLPMGAWWSFASHLPLQGMNEPKWKSSDNHYAESTLGSSPGQYRESRSPKIQAKVSPHHLPPENLGLQSMLSELLKSCARFFPSTWGVLYKKQATSASAQSKRPIMRFFELRNASRSKIEILQSQHLGFLLEARIRSYS